MTDQQFLNYWYIGLSIAAVIVLAVAVLVWAIIATARSILRNAQRALEIANEIVVNTKPIWELQKTNQVAEQLLAGAHAIELHGGLIADALEQPAGQPTMKQ